MKTYEKPRLFALSLSGNDRLCGSCAGGVTLYDNTTLATRLMEFYRFGNINDGIGRDDFENVFGSEGECITQIDSYCKFTNVESGTTLVAWS